MILFINTTEQNKVHLALVNQRVVKKTFLTSHHASHATLKHLEKFLTTTAFGKKKTANKRTTIPLALSSITSIIFCSGPGSLTGIRVGAAIAQGLGFALGISVQAIKKDRVPKNLKDLVHVRGSKKLNIDYGKPAV